MSRGAKKIPLSLMDLPKSTIRAALLAKVALDPSVAPPAGLAVFDLCWYFQI